MYTHNLMCRMHTNFRQNKRTLNIIIHISVTTTTKNAFLLFFYFIHIICIKCNPHQDHWLLIRPVTMIYFPRLCMSMANLSQNLQSSHTGLIHSKCDTKDKTVLKQSSWVRISQFTVSELHENIINKDR